MPAKKHIPKAPLRGKGRIEYLERYIKNLQEEIRDTNDEETKKELRAEITKARAEIRTLRP